MVKRVPVSSKQNNWFDAQQVDDVDLNVEQNHNEVISSGIINNHIGNGVLVESLDDNIIFNSSLENTYLDGVAVYPQNQPTDNSFGNQLSISLTESKAAGKKTVKVAIFGLDFAGNLQYETFVFKTNEIQISNKHYAKVLLLLFNDFVGDENYSFNLGGKIIISEAKPFSLSRSITMVSQEQEPNLFFRDFFLDGPLSIEALLKTSLPLYNTDTLNITTSVKDNKELLANDVVTQIGQKFKATTNNIQKITMLLSVQNQEIGSETDLNWTGDIVVSVYPLQSTIDCITDLAPELEIEFSPSNTPLAQLSFNYATLQSQGIVLDSVPQPVDFIFSNTPLANGKSIAVGNYYTFSVKRSGSADKCDILIASGGDWIADSRITVFSGDIWSDIPEEDLWFIINTDAAKVSDGQGYDSGHGIILPKTTDDLGLEDYSYNNISFVGSNINQAVLSAMVAESDIVKDQRTGNDVYSRKQHVPQIDLLSPIDVANLEKSDPIFLGSIIDKNIKYYDAMNSLLEVNIHLATMVGDELFVKIITDPTDGRYDTSVTALESSLLLGHFVNSKLTLNTNNVNLFYRVAGAELHSEILGDVNGDGLITEEDFVLLSSYEGFNFNTGLSVNSSVTTDGVTTTFVNGYNTLIKPFANQYGFSWQLVDPNTNAVVASGTDGILVPNPSDNRLAAFTSSSENFNIILGLSDYKIVFLTSGTEENYGGFDIVSIDSLTDVLTVRKILLNSNSVESMIRADIDNDGVVTDVDSFLLRNYLDRVPLTTSPTTTYPQPSTFPFNKIGTTFNVIKFKLEKYVDRKDDYSFTINDRSTLIHQTQDLFLNDSSFENHDFYNNPIEMSISKQLSWEDYLVVVNNKTRSVPTIFTSSLDKPSCERDGVIVTKYEDKPEFNQLGVDLYVPNNLIIGKNLHDENGNFYKVDFEVGTITLEIPDGMFGSEHSINIMDDFIVDYTGTGTTRLGYPALKFADCSFVTSTALTDDQLRFSVAVQSFSPNTNGLSEEGYEGVIVDGKMGVDIDYSTGILKLNFTNLYQDTTLKTLTTKVQVGIFLKKGGFNNKPLFIDSTKMSNMLKLISAFSGANVGGVSALVDLEADVTGILPIIHGGTGLNAAGPSGTVLMSNGTSLSYQFIPGLAPSIDSSSGVSDAGKLVKTDVNGKLDSSFYYLNPLIIPVFHNVVTSISSDADPIGAFNFRTDLLLPNWTSIKIEAICYCDNAASPFVLSMKDVTNNVDIDLIAGLPISDNNTSIQLFRSDDLDAQIGSVNDDRVYEILFKSSGSYDPVYCEMVRLVVTY